MTDATTRLQSWYAARCDGSWEHQHGIRIDTIDNPGWTVQIDLAGTNLENERFEPVSVSRSDRDWVHCEVKGTVYEGAGGADNLSEILDIFLRWAGA